VTSPGVSLQKGVQLSAADFDRAGALSRVDGDSELMVSLLDIFFTETAPMMDAIRTSVRSGDPSKLEKAAHRLKGSVSIFCANTVSQTAFELEKIGREGDITKAAETLVRLEQQIADLQPVLKQFRNELQPSP
jgi:HPt (histidine-containing phosphotransfer) domain-containing protein